MALSFAVLSFFAAVFLPGAVAYRLICRKFGLESSLSGLIVASFVLSLCVNFCLIYALVGLGIYTQGVVLGIFALEVVAFLALFWREIWRGIELPSALNGGILEKIVFMLGILLALFALSKALRGDIFYVVDAVASWNRWATEWANGKFVANEMGYSQLYPMLLSLGYVASGKISDFQGVGVAIYQYFAFAGVVACLTVKERYFGALLAAVAVVVSYIIVKEFWIGCADLPVMMTILASAVCLLNASRESDGKSIAAWLILGAFAAGISAEIKQSGLVWCVFYVAGLFFLRTQMRAQNQKISLKIIAICAGITLLFAAPWVIVAIYKKLALSQAATNADHTMDKIFGDKGHLRRLIEGIGRHPQISVLFILSMFGLLNRREKIFGFFAICAAIYFLLWGCLISYDSRNLQGGMPAMMLALSSAIVMFYRQLYAAFCFCVRRIPAIFVAFVVIGLAVCPFSSDRILQSEAKRKMRFGNEFTNQMVLKAFKMRGEKPLLSTDKYYGNHYLADIQKEFDGKKFVRWYHFGKRRENGEFEREAMALKAQHGGIYLLMQEDEFARYEDFLKNATKLGNNGAHILLEF